VTVRKPCLVCGVPSPSSRCALHRAARKRSRNANAATAKAVVEAQPWCSLCGSTRDLTSDHLVPLHAGGSNDPTNQRTLCRSCNSARGNRTRGRRGHGGLA
jgi:5-methylcytosine-specific restriction endonuclease McrA